MCAQGADYFDWKLSKITSTIFLRAYITHTFRNFFHNFPKLAAEVLCTEIL